MQILKSVLVVVLLSFCAFQSNATVLPILSSSVEQGGVIEWSNNGRTLSIQVNTPELVNVTLTDSNGKIIYKDILTGYNQLYIIDLHHLVSGTYKLIATSSSATIDGIVIIE